MHVKEKLQPTFPDTVYTPLTHPDKHPAFTYKGFHPGKTEQLPRGHIAPGTIVALVIPIWPVGMVFEAGEGLMVRVSGHDMSLPEVEMLRLTEPVDQNRGRHIVHTDGDYGSFVALPVISQERDF